MAESGKKFWGPDAWELLRLCAVNVNSKNGKYLSVILWSMTKLLPCDRCKKNLIKKLNKYPPEKYMGNENTAIFYIYMLQDLVNKHITRYHPEDPKFSPPFDQVKNYYFKNKLNKELWGKCMWKTTLVFAATLRPENANDFKAYLQSLSILFPFSNLKTKLNQYPIDSYLTNNHDAFFYVFMLKGENSESFQFVKPYYFRALGKECKDCKV